MVSPQDHSRLLELCEEFEFPAYNTPEPDHNYHIKGYRSHVIIEPEHGEIFKLIHKAHMRIMPKIYEDYPETLPTDIYDKYSGYWLCKYPEGGYISKHADIDADAGSVTISYNINDDYEGGELELQFGKFNEVLKPEAGTGIIFPSWMPHRVKPVTKGKRISLVAWMYGAAWK